MSDLGAALPRDHGYSVDFLHRSQSQGEDPASPPPADLVGRDDELDRLVRLRAPGGTPVLLGPLGLTHSAVLFRRSAALVGVSLGNDETTDARVARICAAVDGNPLAVELAASRLPYLRLSSLEAALSSAQRALSVLSFPLGEGTRGRSTSVAGRQRTSASAQHLLDQLSTFAGSFSIEEMEAVCDCHSLHCYSALEELVHLRLVEMDPGETEGRYRLSRLVRGLAAERLAAVAILGTGLADAVEVLGWLRSRDPATALRLAADLGWYAHRRATGDWLATSMDELCSTMPEETAARRDALLWLVQLRSRSPGAGEGVGLIAQRLTEGLSLARRLAEPLPLLQALRTRFVAVTALGDVPGAMDACREGIALATRLGHARWLGRFEIWLSSMHSLLREHDVAAALAASGLARALRSADRRAVVLASLVIHGLPDGHRLDVPGVPSLETVLAITRELGDGENQNLVLAILAHRAVDRGDADEAASWVLARQEHLRRDEHLHGLTVSVMPGVQVTPLRGDLRASARVHGSVASHARPLLPLLPPVHVQQYQRALDSVRAGLGPAGFEAAVAERRLFDRRKTTVALQQHLDGVAGMVPQPRAAGRAVTAHPALSPREEQVLALLGDGLRNKEIALRLRVTSKTVMHHTSTIYRKLGVRSRTEAVTAGLRLGVLTVD